MPDPPEAFVENATLWVTSMLEAGEAVGAVTLGGGLVEVTVTVLEVFFPVPPFASVTVIVAL